MEQTSWESCVLRSPRLDEDPPVEIPNERIQTQTSKIRIKRFLELSLYLFQIAQVNPHRGFLDENVIRLAWRLKKTSLSNSYVQVNYSKILVNICQFGEKRGFHLSSESQIKMLQELQRFRKKVVYPKGVRFRRKQKIKQMKEKFGKIKS